MKTGEEQDGTIIEFLLGEKSFQGVWFGDENPNERAFGKFWWRPYLREYLSHFKTVEPYRLERPVEDGIAGTELGVVEPENAPYCSCTNELQYSNCDKMCQRYIHEQRE